MKTIAIIICTWNRADSLRATLQSLRQQAANDAVVEVIVVDNNSSDATRATVEELASAWHPGRLRYVFEGRQGKQFALNAGIRACQAELLAFTDDDILFPAGWIDALQAVFTDPHVELAGGRTLLEWPEGGPPRWYDQDMHAILGAVDLGPSKLQPPPPGYAPAGANLVARRSVFDSAGLFSERHFRHMDYEFGIRCAKQGIKLAYAPDLVVYAPVDRAMLTRRYFRRWSFKAGISSSDEDAPNTRLFLGAPRWIFTRLAMDALAWPSDMLLRPANRAFSRQLRIWRALGTISSRWYAKLWPESYPQWVEHYSQKKKNVY
ncbi:glycosyltransferase [Massilia yuzhufengensis]|uniref:Glycosyltransferase, GT2 family n=1 Tax=Massilia yuzhufengensis TaxID=1164594 RepID=A0A1I1DKL2_9BURK|nr:glycosyltransferase family A protein [Massilia yuzhufengensis]SFB74976.1 Glycosyltransferase, GT2 family [Massilia yuzhufengensis]